MNHIYSAVCLQIHHGIHHIMGQKGAIVRRYDSLSQSVQRLIQSRDRRHIICCNHLQIPPSSAAPSAASSAILILSCHTDIMCPFAAFKGHPSVERSCTDMMCRLQYLLMGCPEGHDSRANLEMGQIEGYVIDDRPSQDRCPHLSCKDRGKFLTH